MRSTPYLVRFATAILGFLCTEATAKGNEPVTGESIALSLIENKGQVTDQYQKPRNDIDFKVTAEGMNIFVGDGAIHYQWSRNTGEKQLTGIVQGETKCEIYRMDVVLAGANKHAQVLKQGKQTYCENYHTALYKGTVSSFNKVIYKNIYNNIDWVLYTENDRLKYDFIVHPGGDPKDIQLQYKGATALDMKEGAITATTPYGSITEHKPYSYDAVTRQEIASSFVLTENAISFDIVANNDHDIVIDPVLQWATYYNGLTGTVVLGVAANKVDDAYICGFTPNTSNIATSGAHQVIYGGGSLDAFVAKFHSGGYRQWATYYGGAAMDHFATVAVDTSGNIFLCGESYSTAGVTTTGAYKTTYSGDGDVMLVKMNSSGSVLWGTYFGGTGRETARVALDGSNNAYISGLTQSATGIATGGAAKTTISGSSDAYVAKFNASGALLWASYFGGTGDDEAQTLDCDANGNVYIAGGTYGDATGIATTGAHQTMQGAVLANSTDGFLCKWSPSGSLLWSTYYGGRNFDQVYAVACDATGSNIYMTGTTRSANNIATTGSYQSTADTTQNHAFLAKFNASGVRQWATYYAGNNEEQPRSIDVAADGNIFFSSFTYSTSGIATTGSFKSTLTGFSDYFIAGFTPAGTRNWASYFGGNSYEYMSSGTGSSRIGGGALTTSASGKLYFAGGTYSNSGLATHGAFFTTTGADGSINVYDGFLSSWVTDTVITIDQPFNDTSLCGGQVINIGYSVSFPFRAGNTFVAQLSDASGSFSSPANIGFKADTDSGNIVAMIPASTVAGTGYRVRIVSTNPARISPDNGINIRVKPIPLVNAISNSPACEGDTLKLVATSTVPGAVSYNWSGPNSFVSAQQKPTLAPAATSMSGMYIVVSILNGCYSADTTTVLVNTKPDTPIVSSNSPVCIGDTLFLTASSSTAGVSYEWAGPSGLITMLQNPAIGNVQPARAGTYTVRAFLYNCTSAPASVHVVVINCHTGVEEIGLDKPISLYPNPNKGSFTVSGIRSKEARVEILNSMGQLIFAYNVMALSGSIIINTQLTSGIYFLKIHGSDDPNASAVFTVTD